MTRESTSNLSIQRRTRTGGNLLVSSYRNLSCFVPTASWSSFHLTLCLALDSPDFFWFVSTSIRACLAVVDGAPGISCPAFALRSKHHPATKQQQGRTKAIKGHIYMLVRGTGQVLCLLYTQLERKKEKAQEAKERDYISPDAITRLLCFWYFMPSPPLIPPKSPSWPFCSQQNTTKTGKQALTHQRQEKGEERRTNRNVLHIIIWSQHWLAFTGNPTLSLAKNGGPT